MLIQRSKDWWLRRIANEPDVPISAGGGCYSQRVKQSWPDRIFSRLGFGRTSAPWFDDIAPDHPEWAPGRLMSFTVIDFDFRDRLRILLSGRVMVATALKTDVFVQRSLSSANVSVMSPRDRGAP